MHPKRTLTWFIIAVALFAFIFIYHFFQRPAPPPPSEILPGLRPAAVTSVEVIPAGAREILATRTNDEWRLTQPVMYPAQSMAVGALLDALQKLKPAVRISPAELREIHDANSQYGFETPQISLVIQSGDRRNEILVGNRTTPGDQVFLRVVGVGGVFVTDANWLKLIPQSADDWRDTALASDQDGCNSIILTNGAEIIQLQCNPTNHLWQMTAPLHARANGDYIAGALRQLQTARVSQFITDNSNADLTVFGLQPAALDLWLGRGSNFTDAVHIGKSSTNDSTQVFARRESWNAIFTTAKQPLAPWFGAVNDFRDPYLLEVTAPVAEVDMRGPGTNRLVLQRLGTNGWTIPGANFPVDANSAEALVQVLANLRVSQFVKDVVTPADLKSYGLAAPERQIILRSAVGDTNAIIARLLFSAMRTNAVYVRRADEDFIYAITPEDFQAVVSDNEEAPNGQAWQFRDRRIWNFTEDEVARITARQNGKIEQMVRNGPNQWSLAAGSQGVINPPAIEEIAHQLGTLTAVAWAAHGAFNPQDYGLKSDNLSVTVTLKNDQTFDVDFGAPIPGGQTAYAAVTLDNERWVFIFPPTPYMLVTNYLAISSSTP